MKKINEQTKSFLLYGIEDVIKPKGDYEKKSVNKILL